MEKRLKAFCWQEEGKVSVQISFNPCLEDSVKESFTDWNISASGYDAKNKINILIFTKTIDNSEEIVDIIRRLENKSFLIEEVT